MRGSIIFAALFAAVFADNTVDTTSAVEAAAACDSSCQLTAISSKFKTAFKNLRAKDTLRNRIDVDKLRNNLYDIDLHTLPASVQSIQLAYVHKARGTFPADLDFDAYIARKAETSTDSADASAATVAAKADDDSNRRLQTCTSAPFDLLDYQSYVNYRPCINTVEVANSAIFWAYDHPCFWPTCDFFNIFYPYCLELPEVEWQGNNTEICSAPSQYHYQVEWSEEPSVVANCPTEIDPDHVYVHPGFQKPNPIGCVPQWNGTNPYAGIYTWN